MGQLFPLGELDLEQALTGAGQAVVLARWTVAGFLPGGVDQAVALQAAKEGVESALGGGEGLAERGELCGELVAVVGLAGDEGQDAELEDAAAGLGEPVASAGLILHACSVAQGTL